MAITAWPTCSELEEPIVAGVRRRVLGVEHGRDGEGVGPMIRLPV